MESMIKRIRLLIYLTKWMYLKIIKLTQRNLRKEYIIQDSMYIKLLKKENQPIAIQWFLGKSSQEKVGGSSAGKGSAFNAGDPGSIPGSGGSNGEGNGNPCQLLGFPGGSDSEESTCNVGDLCLIPRLGRSSGGGHGNPLQYSCLENPHRQRSLAGYSPWGYTELDMTEQLSTAL